MGVVSVANGSQLAEIGTEHSLTQQSLIGIYVLKVNVAPLEAGDSLTVRVKDKCLNTDSTQTVYQEILSGVQDVQNYHSPPVPVASGGEFIATIEQETGSPRTFTWNLLRM